MVPPPTHSRILEINLISAEGLAPVCKNMKTYAVAWIQQDRKLTTGVDQIGGTDPSWNDRFMFRVDDNFLNSEDATICVEIYSAARRQDQQLRHENRHVRRPSGGPQGILNMEVALIDSTICSMPQPEDPELKTTSKTKENYENNESQNHKSNAIAKISRSQSDRTELTLMEDNSDKRPKMGSIVNDCSAGKGSGSMVNGDSLCCSDVELQLRL
ncbi:uncharacterized protein LOC111277536 [Durio zibethinus]|uniref:Uncharacterized protein LOC111277536 n=1 Tax=Durio zibethinus TaxID=66656 RepID=A0A6P5WV36_DURZI|nr:uncharacterized protein LOC111277536 [Durio zibethinus]